MPQISMDSDPSMDYSDFEYQLVEFQVNIQEEGDSTGNEGPAASGVTQLPPLADAAGLDNNEVAELVYMETTASIEIESGAGVDNQGEPSVVEFRGVIGANLPESGAASFSFNGPGGTDFTGDTFDVFDIDPDNTLAGLSSATDDRRFQQFETRHDQSFATDANGTGGAGAYDHFHAEKNFRELTGRGPVLDSSDDLTFFGRIIQSDTLVNTSGVVRCHLVWDTAEVSDAGRAFSVPS